MWAGERLVVTLAGLALNSELATLAFLVVFRVLIKLFFWMDMFFALLAKIFIPRGRLTIVQVICQTRRSLERKAAVLKRKQLVPKYQRTGALPR